MKVTQNIIWNEYSQENELSHPQAPGRYLVFWNNNNKTCFMEWDGHNWVGHNANCDMWCDFKDPLTSQQKEKSLLESISGYIDEPLLIDGMNLAIIGIGEIIGNEPVVAYDSDKIIDLLIDQGMSEEEAFEFMNFNIQGSYVGNKTPIFVITCK